MDLLTADALLGQPLDQLFKAFRCIGNDLGAAALLKLPVLFHSGTVGAIDNALLGAVCAAAAAWVSIKFLTRYFQTQTLTPFAIYCAAVGLLSLIVLR